MRGQPKENQNNIKRILKESLRDTEGKGEHRRSGKGSGKGIRGLKGKVAARIGLDTRKRQVIIASDMNEWVNHGAVPASKLSLVTNKIDCYGWVGMCL